MSLSIKETVNSIVLEQLEKGITPRRQTRNSIQISGTSGRPYGWINQLILQIQKMKYQFGSNRRLTFRAINQIGAFVLKGAKWTPIVYFKMIEVEDKDSKELKRVPTLKLYRVFNLEQTTINLNGIPEHDIVISHTAEQIRENFKDKPEVYQHPQPHYNPVDDKIGIPHKNDFKSEANYRATLFHEWIHSTGSHKRIGRKEVIDRNVRFGDCDYSREELVAELWAAYLSAFAGIQDHTIENSAAYIQGRMMKIKDDPDLLIRASANGWKGCEYILHSQIEDHALDSSENFWLVT